MGVYISPDQWTSMKAQCGCNIVFRKKGKTRKPPQQPPANLADIADLEESEDPADVEPQPQQPPAGPAIDDPADVEPQQPPANYAIVAILAPAVVDEPQPQQPPASPAIEDPAHVEPQQPPANHAIVGILAPAVVEQVEPQQPHTNLADALADNLKLTNRLAQAQFQDTAKSSIIRNLRQQNGRLNERVCNLQGEVEEVVRILMEAHIITARFFWKPKLELKFNLLRRTLNCEWYASTNALLELK